MCDPTPAEAGLKIPDEFTPFPDHVPPAVATVSVTGESLIQNVCGIHIVASQQFKAIGVHAEAAKLCIPPVLDPELESPVPPHAIISPPELISTSKTLNAVG
ncbi:MAG: hypothetical protein ACK457_00855 [Flavobacteriia bacterium]